LLWSCFLPGLTWTMLLLFYAYSTTTTRMTGTDHQSQFFSVEMGLANFFFFSGRDWPRTETLQISASLSLGWQVCATIPSY
jgi:hypothetical protein